jgi:hypothetical protein
MSVDIAAVLRDEAKAAQAIAERLTIPGQSGVAAFGSKAHGNSGKTGARRSGLKVNAMQQPSPSGDPRAQFLRRLNHMLAEINMLLTAVAVGLTVLDFTCFVALRVSADIGR